MKLVKLYRASWSSLAGICHTRYALVLLGMVIFTWTTHRRSKPEDWGVIG